MEVRSRLWRRAGRAALLVIGVGLGLFGVTSVLSQSPASAAPPPNDTFPGQDLGGVVAGTVTGTITEAKSEPGEPSCGVSKWMPVQSVWYAWTAPDYGDRLFRPSATVTTRNSAFDTKLCVYTGASVNALTLVATNDDSGGTGQSKVSFSPASLTTYRIQVVGSFATGPLSLQWSGDQPRNDDFPGDMLGDFHTGQHGPAIGVAHKVESRYATGEPGEPWHSGIEPNSSQWYWWTPPESGHARLRLSNHWPASEVGGFSVYTGSTVGTLTRVVDSVGGAADITVTAGATYRIAVDFRADGTEGWLSVAVNPVANDLFANRQTLPGNRGIVTGSNVRSTGDNGAGPPMSVWYSWTPTVSGPATITLAGSHHNIWASVFTGSSLDALTHIGCCGTTDDWDFPVKAGTTYQVSVGSNGGGGPVRLQYSVPVPPNDDLRYATVVTPTGGTAPVNTDGATPEPDEQPLHGGCAADASVWYRVTPKASGPAEVRLDRLAGPWVGHTAIAVYRGPYVSYVEQVLVAEAAGTVVAFDAAAGTNYFVAVDGCGGTTGTGRLLWKITPPKCDGRPATIIGAGTIAGTDGNDVIIGSSGADTILAGAGNDTVCGGDGADTIVDGTGIDGVFGEGGDDTFGAGNLPDGGDRYVGGAGVDRIVYSSRHRGVRVSLDGLANDGETGERDTVFVENIIGSAYDDVLSGSAGPNQIQGTLGDDVISGLAGNDDLQGQEGNDQVRGGAGDDVLNGGTAADGADVLDGGDGVDTASYAHRSQAVSLSLDGVKNDGESGELDNVIGTERLYGGAGNDILSGNGANNILVGNDGDDTIKGGAGADSLGGGNGNDALDSRDGVRGNDTVDGGAGTDTAATDPGDSVVGVP